LVGHNTDTTGFERAVQNLPPAVLRGPVALIGAGGVGKAIAFALSRMAVEDALRGAAGLVNATPVGMLPNRDMPVPESLLHRDLWVADAVYTPLVTPLLVAARAKGAEVMTGRDLAIYQAADAFELFTALKPSIAEIGRAFDAVMAERYGR